MGVAGASVSRWSLTIKFFCVGLLAPNAKYNQVFRLIGDKKVFYEHPYCTSHNIIYHYTNSQPRTLDDIPPRALTEIYPQTLADDSENSAAGYGR